MESVIPGLRRALRTVSMEANEHAENTLILHPDLPVAQVASAAAGSIDSELRDELVAQLLPEYFAKLIRAIRRKQAPPKTRPLPGFEHLPSRIQGRKKVKLLQFATYTDMERYVKFLGRQSRETDKYKEAVKLRDRLKRRKGGTRVEDLF